MPLSNSGRSFLVNALMGSSVVFFNQFNSFIGVGNSDSAFSVSQTDLQGTSKIRASMVSGYPKKDPNDSNTIIFKASFSTSVGNFHWKEWGVFNSVGVMLVRVVEDIGIKREGSTWVFEVSITFE